MTTDGLGNFAVAVNYHYGPEYVVLYTEIHNRIESRRSATYVSCYCGPLRARVFTRKAPQHDTVGSITVSLP